MKVEILDDSELWSGFKPAKGLIVDVVEENTVTYIIKHPSWNKTQCISKLLVNGVEMTKEEQLKATIDNLQSALNEAKEELERVNAPDVKFGQLWEDDNEIRFIVLYVNNGWCDVLQENNSICTHSIDYIKSNCTLICNAFNR